MPKGIELKKPCSKKDVLNAISNEIDKYGKEYQIAEKKIRDFWEKDKIKINIFFNRFGYPVPENIKIFLTRYGPGGYYELPDKITLRINQNFGNVKRSLEETLIHEIIHLILENPVVKKIGLNHEEKENLIESFFEKRELKMIFPEHQFSPRYSRPRNEILRKICFK